ncbi:hypothetical protein MUG78_17070 [Gordonia alkaliphila]|uniref:hypothetical protein n=1 Tax=Gordonia alkaliphila TaxID=1053547 RepID=UPI001FF4EE84|nr:hypothetical protein [Gordonia alkaliphila]MCK0441113.1 hypothetical protein [Gordonia alkaliphila]
MTDELKINSLNEVRDLAAKLAGCDALIGRLVGNLEAYKALGASLAHRNSDGGGAVPVPLLSGQLQAFTTQVDNVQSQLTGVFQPRVAGWATILTDTANKHQQADEQGQRNLPST